MKSRQHLNNIIIELEAILCDLRDFRHDTEAEITENWHDQVIIVLKSVVARAENMEMSQKELI